MRCAGAHSSAQCISLDLKFSANTNNNTHHPFFFFFFSFQYIFCKKFPFRFIGRHSKTGLELRKLTPALMFSHMGKLLSFTSGTL